MKTKPHFIILSICMLFLIQPLKGQTWDDTKRLTFNTGESRYPRLVTESSGTIHVVWQDNSPGNPEIYYKKSTNGGATWTSKRLTSHSGDSWHPDIAIDTSGNIYVVWIDNIPYREIFFGKSTNSGTSWTNRRLTWTTGDSYDPAIAVDASGHIHVVWYDFTPAIGEIYYKKSTNGGNTWTTKRLTWNSEHSMYPDITIDTSGYIHVIWENMTSGNREIYHKKSTNGGTTWSTQRLTWTTGHSQYPRIAVNTSGHIYVVWQDTSPGIAEIYFKKSTNGGVTWTTKRLTWNSGGSEYPAITSGSGGNIYITWRDLSPGNSEIFYKKSTNGGTTWTSERLTWNTDWSDHPDIDVDMSKDVYVIWQNSTPGSIEIYYKVGKH